MMNTLDMVEISQDLIEVEIPTDDLILIDTIDGEEWCISELNTNTSKNCITVSGVKNIYDSSPVASQVKGDQNNPSTKIAKDIKITQITALYSCKLCKYNTLKRETMAEHLKMHGLKRITVPKPKLRRKRSETQNYVPCPDCTHKCPHCSFFSKNMSSLKIHMRIHLKERPYKCVDCDFHAKDLKELGKHYGEDHSKNRTLICEFCGFNTNSRTKFNIHRRTHSNKSV